ncbi:Uncharacterised protein [Mycobacteroides abscessus subsp. abscessus]|nr:Uncharacterised protein [Mycobacteroides abscessus subsp. abscessus]
MVCMGDGIYKVPKLRLLCSPRTPGMVYQNFLRFQKLASPLSNIFDNSINRIIVDKVFLENNGITL